MAKLDVYTRNRNEGLAWALDIVKRAKTPEQGIDALEREVRYRRATFTPLELSREQISKCSERLAARVVNTVIIVVIRVLTEDFGFGEKRLRDFLRGFTKKTDDIYSFDPYADQYTKFSDWAELFREKYGICMEMQEVRMVEELNASNMERRVQWTAVEKLLADRYPEALEWLKKCMGLK